MRVFVADDDPCDLREVQRTYSKLSPSTELSSFVNGKPLVEEIGKGNLPDYILLDMNMPTYDGYKVLEFLGSHPDATVNKIPVLVMSSSRVHEEILRERGCIPSGFVRKPVSFTAVKKAVESLNIL